MRFLNCRSVMLIAKFRVVFVEMLLFVGVMSVMFGGVVSREIRASKMLILGNMFPLFAVSSILMFVVFSAVLID